MSEDDIYTVGPPAPMPTQDDRIEAWAQLFKARIMQRGGVDERVAQAEYEALEDYCDYDVDPELSADEALSYWDADE